MYLCVWGIILICALVIMLIYVKSIMTFIREKEIFKISDPVDSYTLALFIAIDTILPFLHMILDVFSNIDNVCLVNFLKNSKS